MDIWTALFILAALAAWLYCMIDGHRHKPSVILRKAEKRLPEDQRDQENIELFRAMNRDVQSRNQH